MEERVILDKPIVLNTEQKIIAYKGIGEGGMGAVFVVADCIGGQKIGLKMVPPSETKPAERIQTAIALRDEAKNLAKIQQQCREYFLCSYGLAQSVDNPLDINDKENTDIYLLMEFILGGTSLEEYMEEKIPLKTTSEFVGREERDDLAIQLIQALSVMHELGLAHQDIKEGNIMWDFKSTRDCPRFIDFGTGFRRGDPKNEYGGFVGTLYTSSPEIRRAIEGTDDTQPSDAQMKQWWGGTKAEYLWKTAVAHDVWSIGVILLNWYGFEKINTSYAGKELVFMTQAEIDGLINNSVKSEFARGLIRLLLETDPKQRLENWDIAKDSIGNRQTKDWKTPKYVEMVNKLNTPLDEKFQNTLKKCTDPNTKWTTPMAKIVRKRKNVAPAQPTRQLRARARMESGEAFKLIKQDIYDTYTLKDVIAVATKYKKFDENRSLEETIDRIARVHLKKLSLL